jgi:UDP-2,3-diacylglucosamine hydrolase
MKRTRFLLPHKSTARNKTYFFSDAHLGLGPIEEDRQKELRLVHFLDDIRHDAEQIFIVGDLFDYWFEYKTVVPKRYFRLFTKLSEIIESGTRVVFTVGNHDFWVKDYFQAELGLIVYHDPIDITLHGKRFYIHHGDGLLQDDRGYKILKKILRNKFNIFLFSLIHPDITGWIARWSSRTSRRYTSKRTYESSGMIEFASHKLQEGFDFIIMGHNHIPSRHNIQNGIYINLGDWIFENTYAVFDGAKLELKKWNKRSNTLNRVNKHG